MPQCGPWETQWATAQIQNFEKSIFSEIHIAPSPLLRPQVVENAIFLAIRIEQGQALNMSSPDPCCCPGISRKSRKMAKNRFSLEDNPKIIPVFYTPLASSNRAESIYRHYRPLGPLTVFDWPTHEWSACMPRGRFLLLSSSIPRLFCSLYFSIKFNDLFCNFWIFSAETELCE